MSTNNEPGAKSHFTGEFSECFIVDNSCFEFGHEAFPFARVAIKDVESDNIAKNGIANEFKFFIGESIRLEPVVITKDIHIKDILEFYMGKNTPDRQDFIIRNLRVEKDEIVEKKEIETEPETE
jgi:hypothetical protein